MVERIELHGKYGAGKFALVDNDDFERVNCHSWHVTGEGYARCRIGAELVLLHRYILFCTPDDPRIDHKNLNKLDCRRDNLRFATFAQNRMNIPVLKNSATQIKGVHKYKNRWRAKIQTGQERLFLGSFRTVRSAAKAYNDAALKYFGEYAQLNDLSQLPPEEDPAQKPPQTSSYRGVHLGERYTRKWIVDCEVLGHRHHVGRFDTEVAAARAYDAFVREHKLNRPLNFPDID